MIITLDGQADQKAFFISNFQNITLAQPIAACTATNFDNSTKQLKGQALMCHISYGGDLIIATKHIGFYGATSGFTKLDGVLSLQKPPGPHRDHSLWISQDSSASTITFGSNKRYQIDFGGGPTLAHVNKPIGDIYISTGTKIKNDFFSPGNSRGSCFFGTYSIYYTSTQGGPGLPSNVFPTVTAGNPSGLTYRGVSNYANWSPPTPLIADKEMQISLYNKMAQKAWFSAPREGIHEAQPIPACTTDMIYPNNNTLKDGTTMCYGVNGTDMIIVTKRFQGSHGSANVINPPQTPVNLNPPPPPDPGSSSITSLAPSQNFASLSPQFTAFGIIPRGASIGGDINVNTDTRFGPPNSKGDVVIQANTKVKPAALFDTDVGRPCISVNFRDPAILITPPTVLRGADAMGFDLSTSTGLTPVCTIDPTTFNGTLLTDKELRITLYPNATTDTIAPHFFSQEQGNSATKPIPLCTSTNMHANQTLIGDTEMCYGTHGNNTIIISKRIGIYSANAPTGTIVPDPVSTPVNTVNGTISFTVSGTWTPGEQATVSISDADQNKNSAADDDQTISNVQSRIPTLITGDPHTLKDGDTDQIYAYTGQSSTWIPFLQDPSQSYIHQLNYKTDDSHRGIISWTGGDLSNNAETLSLGGAGVGPMLAIPLGTLGDLRDSINDDDLNGTGNFTGRNLINYDFGSLTPNIRKSQLTIVNSAGTYLYSGVFASDDTRFPNHNAKSDILDITGFTVAHQTGTDYVLTGPDLLSQPNVNDNSQVLWIIEFSESLVLTEGIEYPIVLDFISYGFYGDGDSTDERIANQIIRIAAEETGVNTGTFTGTISYILINQLDTIVHDDIYWNSGQTQILETPYIYETITPTGKDATFIAFEGMTAQVNYTDINSNGVDTVLSAQQDIITNTGTVSLNNTSYDTGDAVTITLVDPDLDRDTSTADVYNVFQDSTDPDRDLVGKNAQGSQETLLSGRSLGMLLEVTLNGTKWQFGTCTLTGGTPNGLGGTTFALQETGPNTGTFTGTFYVPAQFCDGADTVYTNGTNIGVTYLDFRNATGSIVTASDTASIAAAVTTPTPP